MWPPLCLGVSMVWASDCREVGKLGPGRLHAWQPGSERLAKLSGDPVPGSTPGMTPNLMAWPGQSQPGRQSSVSENVSQGFKDHVTGCKDLGPSLIFISTKESLDSVGDRCLGLWPQTLVYSRPSEGQRDSPIQKEPNIFFLSTLSPSLEASPLL